jgi:hypothetical protein
MPSSVLCFLINPFISLLLPQIKQEWQRLISSSLVGVDTIIFDIHLLMLAISYWSIWKGESSRKLMSYIDDGAQQSTATLSTFRFMPRVIEGHNLTQLEREGALWAKALEHFVALTPGSNYYHPHNGTFRLTFTLRRPALLEGLIRLEKTLGLKHWEEAGEGIVEEEPMRQTLARPETVLQEVESTTCQVPSEQYLDEESTNLELSYSDVVIASEILKGQPCAC